MINYNNSQDKGYTCIRLKPVDGRYHLCDLTPDDSNVAFYIDYEDGKIFIDWHNGTKEIIGYYEQICDETYLAKVYDRTREKVIGRVGKEMIYFRKNDIDYAAERYSPEESLLAYYNKSGSITGLRLLPHLGLFNGSELGGAAAFVAIFYSYRFESVFYDYFNMDTYDFMQKYSS